MRYWKKQKKWFFVLFFFCASYQCYLMFLVPEVDPEYVIYLDVLLVVAGAIFVGVDSQKERREERRKEGFLEAKRIVSKEMEPFENQDIALHDVGILEAQLREQFDANCNLEDYIARWCHEIKIPLAAGLLLAEKIQDEELRRSMQEQLERMNQQLRQALLGCRLQSSIFDIQVRQVPLIDCVRTSLWNNQFFLLRKQFEMEINVKEETVYTDQSWLVYVLDQLIQNAVKYAREEPFLRIQAEREEKKTLLFVEDRGEGIEANDIRRIFEKGFTGKNHHNGRYKSTGMGLYMVSVILKKLGHGISVESEVGVYTRFRIEFVDNREFFHL